MANLRDGQMAKSVARISLDANAGPDPFTSHPVIASWRAALTRDSLDATTTDIEDRVVMAASVALGWAMYADFLGAALDLDDDRCEQLNDRMMALIAELGGIPD